MPRLSLILLVSTRGDSSSCRPSTAYFTRLGSGATWAFYFSRAVQNGVAPQLSQRDQPPRIYAAQHERWRKRHNIDVCLVRMVHAPFYLIRVLLSSPHSLLVLSPCVRVSFSNTRAELVRIWIAVDIDSKQRHHYSGTDLRLLWFWWKMSAPWSDHSSPATSGVQSSSGWVASPALKSTIVLAQCRSWLLAEEESRCPLLAEWPESGEACHQDQSQREE